MGTKRTSRKKGKKSVREEKKTPKNRKKILNFLKSLESASAMKKTFTINEITSVKCYLRGAAFGMGY